MPGSRPTSVGLPPTSAMVYSPDAGRSVTTSTLKPAEKARTCAVIAAASALGPANAGYDGSVPGWALPRIALQFRGPLLHRGSPVSSAPARLTNRTAGGVQADALGAAGGRSAASSITSSAGAP